MTIASLEPATRPTPTSAAGSEPTSTICLPTHLLPIRGAIVPDEFLELSQAYKAIASRNAEKLASLVRALATVKTAAEFAELQRSLLIESVANAISDRSAIAKLTAAALTASFEPMRKHIGDLGLVRSGKISDAAPDVAFGLGQDGRPDRHTRFIHVRRGRGRHGSASHGPSVEG